MCQRYRAGRAEWGRVLREDGVGPAASLLRLWLWFFSLNLLSVRCTELLQPRPRRTSVTRLRGVVGPEQLVLASARV